MNPDGTNPVNLTPGSAADDLGPSWSADGRKIVVVSNRETPKESRAPGESHAPDLSGSWS